jgi:isoquinoline 1-oxidoreductase beta subunit
VEQGTVAAILGTTPDKVRIHSTSAGGSFGRRATPNADYIAQASILNFAERGA